MKSILIALIFLLPATTFAVGSTYTTYPTKDKATTTYPVKDKSQTTVYDKMKTTNTYDKTKATGVTLSESERQQEMIRLQNLIAQLLQQLIQLLQIQQKALGQ